MLKNRNGSRRSFTVETKGGGRGRATIPSRGAEPARATSAVFRAAADEGEAPAIETRRILPNLITPVPPVEPELDPPPRRGRPRKTPTVAAEPVAATAPPPASKPATVPPRPVRRPTRVWAALPAGERWKHRLPRWAR